MTAPVRLLRLPEVMRLTGYSRDTIYRLGREKKFPQRIELSERASRWREDEITEWIERHSAARHEGAAA
jgi:prophage regulatory protein